MLGVKGVFFLSKSLHQQRRLSSTEKFNYFAPLFFPYPTFWLISNVITWTERSSTKLCKWFCFFDDLFMCSQKWLFVNISKTAPTIGFIREQTQYLVFKKPGVFSQSKSSLTTATNSLGSLFYNGFMLERFFCSNETTRKTEILNVKAIRFGRCLLDVEAAVALSYI